MSSSTQYTNMADHNEIDVSSNNQEDNAIRRRSSSLSSGDDDDSNKDTTAAVDNNNNKPILSYTDYGQRRPARRSSRYTNNKQQQQPPQSTPVALSSSPLDSAHGIKEDNTSSFSTNNNTMSDKKRESWQINTDWDYNYDNSFTSQASLYHVLDELDEEQNDELVDETKQTPNEEKEFKGDDTIDNGEKPNNNNIGEEFELPLQFEPNRSSSDTATTFSKPVRNNNTLMLGSLKSNNNDNEETRRSDSNRSFGSKGSSKGSNAPRGRYSIDANDDFGSLHTNNNKRGLLSKAQTQSLRSININSGSGGENKTYKRSVQDTLRHDEGLASSIFSRNSDCSFGSVSASDRSGSGSNLLYGSSGTNITNTTTTMANESWTTSNTSSGARERLNEN